MVEKIAISDMIHQCLEGLKPAFIEKDALHGLAHQIEPAYETYASESNNLDDKNKARNQLNQAMWQTVEAFFLAKLVRKPEVNSPMFQPFSDQEKILLDFGYLTEDMAGLPASGLLSYMQELSQLPNLVRPILLHDHFDDMARQIFFPTDEIQRLKEKKKKLKKQSEKKSNELAEAKKAHYVLLNSLKDSEKLLALQQKLDELLPSLSGVSTLKSFSPEKYKQVQKLTEASNRLRQLQENLIPTYNERNTIKRSLNNYFSCETGKKKVENELAVTEQQIRQKSFDAANLTQDILHVKVSREFKRLRSLASRLNKQANIEFPQIFLEHAIYWTPKRLDEEMQEIFSVDVQLKRNWEAGVWQRPNLVLMPGIGFADFDPEQNVILLPCQSQDVDFHPITSSMGKYRFHADPEKHTELIRTKALKGYAMASEQDKTFAHAYELYIKVESKGFRKLSAEGKHWFDENLK